MESTEYRSAKQLYKQIRLSESILNFIDSETSRSFKWSYRYYAASAIKKLHHYQGMLGGLAGGG
jgi:hypothetical protein